LAEVFYGLYGSDQKPLDDLRQLSCMWGGRNPRFGQKFSMACTQLFSQSRNVN
jgi:hypothetical protein